MDCSPWSLTTEADFGNLAVVGILETGGRMTRAYVRVVVVSVERRTTNEGRVAEYSQEASGGTTHSMFDDEWSKIVVEGKSERQSIDGQPWVMNATSSASEVDENQERVWSAGKERAVEKRVENG
jgi:hypothetical protein